VRLAFFALLLLNLAYFAWANWIDVPRPAPVNESITRLPRLKLVDELPPGERPQAHTAQKMSLSPAAACLSVGPFSDQASSVQAAAVLKRDGFEPHERAEQAQASASYSVYVASLSQPQADAALVALEREGVEDARVVPENSPAGHRLSLGIYSDRVRAERRAEAVRRAGLAAGVAERKLSAAVYWLDLAMPAEMAAVPVQDLQADGSDSRVSAQPCPSAAAPSPAVTSNSTAPHPASPAPQKLATAARTTGRTVESPKLH
jgi:hypothetical protein